MAALHVACWREAYRGIVPDAILDTVDMAERENIWNGILTASDNFVEAAFRDGVPVGFITASENRDPAVLEADGHVRAIYVLARAQRQGIGRRLMADAAVWWLNKGGRALGLGVLSGNARAMAFYDALGGRITRRGTYAWRGHDLPDASYVFENLGALAALA